MSVITGLYAFGENIETILLEWEYMGIFEYVLPFLLLFAVVFGILMKSSILGENKGVNIVISLVVAAIAVLSVDFRSFFRVVMPYAGIGIVILLVGIILVGLFCDSGEKWWKIVFYSLGALIFVIVVFSALTSYEVAFMGSWWWRQYLSAIIVGAVIVGLILLVVLSQSSSSGGGRRSGG